MGMKQPHSLTPPTIRYYSAKGGSFINSGTYGCAFSPPIECEVKAIQIPAGVKVVGKIFSSKKAFKEELDIVKLILKFDKNHSYTVPYYGHCMVHKSDFKPSDETYRCSQHIQLKKNRFPQIIYQYGGIDLKEYYNYSTRYSIAFDEFLKLFYPLMEGIQEIHAKGFVHVDIKPPNILFDPSLPKMYLIDFGLITPLVKMSQEDYLLRHEYPYYPPEFKLLHEFKTGGFVAVEPMFQLCLRNFNYFSQSVFINWLEKSWPTYQTELRAFVSKSAQLGYAGFSVQFNNQYVHTIDSYGLAMTMIEMIYRMVGKPKVYSNGITADFVENLMKDILFPMIRPDPELRMGMTEATSLMAAYFGIGKARTPSAASAPSAKSRSAPSAKPPAPKAVVNKKKDEIPSPLQKVRCLTMTQDEIIRRLTAFQLDTTGSVAELCERLKTYYISQYPSDKLLSQCHLSEAKGGIPLKELRRIATALGFKLIKRADICNAFKRLHA
jgi:serine/threonine protein kinase